MSSLQLFAQFEVFSSHWGLVLTVGFTFLALQISLCIRFLRRMGRNAHCLQALYKEAKSGGIGRDASQVSAADFEWLNWVNEVFPLDEKTSGNYSRDQILQELDTRIAGSSDYLMLQRLGVMAPLLGVVLTVIGFKYLDLPEEAGIDVIFTAVTPLVAGVGAGAVLAMVSQALLHLAGNRAESVRTAARNWFDVVIWSSAGLDTEATTMKAIQAIEKMSDSIAQATSIQTDNAVALANSATAIQRAGEDLQKSVATFDSSLKQLPQTLADLEHATSSTATTLTQLIPIGQRAIAGLDVSVAAFRTAVEQDFVKTADLHRSTLDRIESSVSRIDKTTEQLHGSAVGLRESFAKQQESVEALNSSVQTQLLPIHHEFQTVMTSLSEQMDAFRSLVADMSVKVAAVTVEFDQVTGNLQPSVAAFRETIDESFSVASGLYQESTETLASGVERLHQASEALSLGTSKFETLLRGQIEAGQHLEPTQAALTMAVDKIANVGNNLQTSLDTNLIPSQRSMQQATEAFVSSTETLTQFVQQLPPATLQLQKLDETFTALQGTAEAIRNFNDVRDDLQKQTDSLMQVANVTGAISSLPDHIRSILEETIAKHSPAEASHGNLVTRLLRRHS